MPIFLDNASTTPLDYLVLEEMVLAMKNIGGNPSSIHSEGRIARAEIEKSRNSIANLIHCKPSEIIFNSGGTESNNLVLFSCIAYRKIKTIITSRIEHPAVLTTLQNLQKTFQFSLIYVDLLANGDVNLEDLEKKLYKNPQTLVSLMHGNNEIGNLLDLYLVGNLCKKYNAIFHSDTVQTIGYYCIDLEKTPIDFVTFSAHKIHGPKGVGFLYAKNKKNLNPMIFGGGQELGLRSGTENIHSIIGMRKSLEIAYQDLVKTKKQIEELKTYTIQKLQESFPKAEFNGNCLQENSLYKLINVSLPFKNELIGFQLDLKGICVSQGSACSSGAAKLSHVIEEVSKNKNYTPLRISFSKFNSKKEIDFLIESLIDIEQNH